MVLVLWVIGAILGNGYRIKGQNYVVLLQGSGMPAGFHSRNLILRICFRLLILNVFQWSNSRVQIITLHFANCKVNSSYCNCRVVNHTKIAKQFFSKAKFNLSKLYFSTLYPYFIHPLHTIIKRNVGYTQITPQNVKKCFAILKHLQKALSPVAE